MSISISPSAKATTTEWHATVRAYLQETCSLASGTTELKNLVVLDDDVWLIERTDGTKLVAKYQPFGLLTQGQPYDLLSVEQKVLTLLNTAACPVPQVLGLDPTNQFIFFSYCGPQTLDNAISQDTDKARQHYLAQVIDGLKLIDAVFLDQETLLQPLVAPALRKKALDLTWRQCSKQAYQGLTALAANTNLKADAVTRLTRYLETILLWLGARQPVLGTSDYRAANLVIEPIHRQLYFIEFAKIGWDWTERRLTQYTSTTGVGQKSGFCTLLDKAALAQYASLDHDSARALDYHFRVFWLNAAAQLGQALEEPVATNLLQAWSAPSRRWQQLVRLLARELVTDDPWSYGIRREFICDIVT